jgi:uncharacterized protein (TIGR02145 family)
VLLQRDSEAQPYGKLYNWYAVMGITTEDAPPTEGANRGKKTISASWHVPSETEWTTLTTFG